MNYEDRIKQVKTLEEEIQTLVKQEETLSEKKLILCNKKYELRKQIEEVAINLMAKVHADNLIAVIEEVSKVKILTKDFIEKDQEILRSIEDYLKHYFQDAQNLGGTISEDDI